MNAQESSGLDLSQAKDDMQVQASQAASSNSSPAGISAQPERPPRQSRRQLDARRSIDESYFQSYGEFGIHKEMLSDKVKSLAHHHMNYRRHNIAIMDFHISCSVDAGASA